MSSSSPQPKGNPFELTIPLFRLNFETLKLLVSLEKHAIEAVNVHTATLMKPGTKLVGADGKPLKSVADDLQTEITRYLLELIPQPTLDEEWIAAPTAAGKTGSVYGYSMQIAYLCYQEFARVLQYRGAGNFSHIPDALLTQGLNALHHEIDPLDAYARTIKAKATDDAGNPILGQDAAMREALKPARQAFLLFLRTKGLLVDPVQEGGLPTLHLEGVRLLKHLLAVLGSTESMRSQGPAIMQEVQKASTQGETKTVSRIQQDIYDVERQLEDPNATFPEA